MLPVGPEVGSWRFVKKSSSILGLLVYRSWCVLIQRVCVGAISLTSRPKASRVRIRLHVLLHSLANSLISPSCGARDGGSGCWALPSLKSPKFMALDEWSGAVLLSCLIISVDSLAYSLKSPVYQIVRYIVLRHAHCTTYPLVLRIESFCMHSRPSAVLSRLWLD